MNVKEIVTTKGEKRFKPIFDAEFEALLDPRNLEDPGFCIYCGREASGVEPDARKYNCESCNRNGVYGLEELILIGYVAYPEPEEKSHA